MCGIFGIMQQEAVDRVAFCQLAEQNEIRGNMSFGYLTGHINEMGIETAVSRFPNPFNPSLVQLDNVQVALGHIRAPTNGQSNALTDVHPFASSDAWLAHNGIILNHWQYPQWQLHTDSLVDSQFILGGIQEHLSTGFPITQAIQATVTKLDGQQACWLWYKPTGALYLWRVMSPIYVQQTPKMFVFSSVRSASGMTLLKEGGIFRFQLQTMDMEQVGSFTFYSPYQVN